MLSLLLSIALVLQQPAARWQASVSPAGSIQLRMGSRDIGVLEPGLYEAVWRGASLAPSRPGQAQEDGGLLLGRIVAPGGGEVSTEVRLRRAGDSVELSYHLTPRREMSLNSLHVGLSLPADLVSGGRFEMDGKAQPFPAQHGEVRLAAGAVRTLAIRLAGGGALRFQFVEPTTVMVQDDRLWGPSFTVRIGREPDPSLPWPAGKPAALAFTLSAEGGLDVVQDRPVNIVAGKEWIPLETEMEIEPGSALDFSRVVPWHAPAGTLGRIIVTPGGRLAFEKQPSRPVRFYGINLCFSAQYLTHEESDRLAERLRRIGYNSVRLHHYEGLLVDRSQGSSTRLQAEALERLDYLAAALKKRGLYLTTDLYVSRAVFADEVWPGATGDVGMDEFKMAAVVNDRAYENFKAFTRALLTHRNPYTGLTWAEDPALAWISLINEGNPGNFVGLLKGRLLEDWTRAWNRWLATRFSSRDQLVKALGALPEEQEPARGNVPMPLDKNGTPAWNQLNAFFADNQRDFFERTRAFLRDEIGCKALLTNNNAWTNPLQMQTVRGAFDYVDDHFYVDHPEFLERPWSLPSRCPNTSPVAQGAPGGRGVAFHRLLDRPASCSEYNYSGPGRFRGVGGILTGALGALQGWDTIWRFAYGHNREALFRPAPANYFDIVTDPLNLAAERASICLFLRGDLKTAPHAVAVPASRKAALEAPESSRAFVPGWGGLAWITRVGGLVDEDMKRKDAADLVLGRDSGIDPYEADAGQKILAEMKRRGWLSETNTTDLKANRFQSETGEVTVDGGDDRLTLDTERTAGGYAPAGKSIKTKHVSVRVDETDATVWVSSLDNRPISRSRRLLITHLTDLQNSGARYGDMSRRVLLAWGGLPHLVRAGRSKVTIQLANAHDAVVWTLSTSGKRIRRVTALRTERSIEIPLIIDRDGKACILYEVEVMSRPTGRR